VCRWNRQAAQTGLGAGPRPVRAPRHGGVLERDADGSFLYGRQHRRPTTYAAHRSAGGEPRERVPCAGPHSDRSAHGGRAPRPTEPCRRRAARRSAHATIRGLHPRRCRGRARRLGRRGSGPRTAQGSLPAGASRRPSSTPRSARSGSPPVAAPTSTRWVAAHNGRRARRRCTHHRG